MNESLQRLGREVAEALGDGVDDLRRRRQHARLLAEIDRSSFPIRRRLVLVGVGFAALALIGAFGLWAIVGQRSAVRPPHCWVRGADRTLAAGDWIDASGGQSVSLDFAEGSTVTVGAGGRARLAELTAKAVRVTIEAGRLRTAIHAVHRRRWIFEAGPYRVEVRGTELAISWNAEQRRLVVAVDRGHVRVFGKHITGGGISVAAGQVLSADLARGEVRLAAADGEPELTSSADAGRTDTSLRDARPIDEEPAPSRARQSPNMLWRALAQRGEHRQAVAAAERAGFNEIVRQVGPDDLLLLADAARLGGRPRRARQALLGTRRRFAHQHAGRIAAFRLGRLAYDQSDPRAAARWFSTFLRQAGSSSLAADARGRLMQSLQQAGDLRAARRVARGYLRRHPDGAYRAAAAALVGEQP